ncbi:MAG: PAS domain-containing protein [Stellaceae bacterium]
MSSPFSHEFDPDISDNPRFQDLVAYWQKKRGGRALPLRKDIDPLELQPHLGSLVIIECLPGLTNFRYRLFGTKVVAA